MSNARPPTAPPLELQPITFIQYHTAQPGDLANLLEQRGWQRRRRRWRASTLELARGRSSIVMTPSGCVSALGPGAVIALYLAAYVDPNDAEQGGQR